VGVVFQERSTLEKGSYTPAKPSGSWAWSGTPLSSIPTSSDHPKMEKTIEETDVPRVSVTRSGVVATAKTAPA
jgi:hypothetical protein